MFDFFRKKKTTVIEPSSQLNSKLNLNSQAPQTAMVEFTPELQPVIQENSQVVALDFVSANPVPQNSTVSTSVQTKTGSISNSDDSEIFDFVNALVMAILGLRIEELPSDKAQEVAQECLNIFSNYIIKYVATKYGEKDAIRLKASQQFYDDKIFAKFEDLGSKFDDAYISFIELLKSSTAVTQKI